MPMDHPLTPDMRFHGEQRATIESLGFFHGGEPFYGPPDLPGVWLSSPLPSVAS